MATFSDKAGRTWNVRITAYDLREIRDRTGLTLGAMELPALFTALADPVQLCAVLWCLVADQAAAVDPPVSERAFWEAMSDEAVEAASSALVEAIADFCPSRRRAELLKRTAAAGREVEARILAEAEAALQKADGSRSAADSPASSASTPEG